MNIIKMLPFVLLFIIIGCTGEFIKVSPEKNLALSPSLCWNAIDKEFGITWHESRNGRYDIYFARYDIDGGKIGKDILVTSDKNRNSASMHPQMAFTNKEYGIVWQDERDGSLEIYFRRLNKRGNKIGNANRITNKGKNRKPSKYPSIVFTGSEYGIVWEDYRNYSNINKCDIYFVRLNADGQRTIEGGDVKVVSAIPAYDNPAIIYDRMSKEFAIAWQAIRPRTKEKKIFYARMESNGKLIDKPSIPIAVSPKDAFYPSMVHTGNNNKFAIAWHDTRAHGSKIYFKQFKWKEIINRHTDKKVHELEGDKEIPITDNVGGAVYTSLVWNGREYGLSWLDNRDGYVKVHFTKISASGHAPNPKNEIIIAPNFKAKLSLKELNKPSLVWVSALNKFYVAWADNREGNYRVYLSKVERKNK